MDDNERCESEASVNRGYVPHTVRCTKKAGHDASSDTDEARHECTADGRWSCWYGTSAGAPESTRFRFEKPKKWVDPVQKLYQRHGDAMNVAGRMD